MSDKISFDSNKLLNLLRKRWWFFLLSFAILFGAASVALFFSNITIYSSTTELFISTTGASYANYIFENTKELVKTDYFYNNLNSHHAEFISLSLSKEEYDASITTKKDINVNYFYIISSSNNQEIGYNVSKICSEELFRLIRTKEAKNEFPFLYKDENVFGTSVKNYYANIKKTTNLYHYVGAGAGSFLCSFLFTVLIYSKKYEIIKKEE